MIRYHKQIFLIFFIFTINSFAHAASLDDKIEFAEHLAKTNRPTHALIEYERLMFFEKSCSDKLKVLNSALRLFREGYLVDKSKITFLIEDLEENCDHFEDKNDLLLAEFLSYKGKILSDQLDIKEYPITAKLSNIKAKELLHIRLQKLYEKNLINENNIIDDYYLNKARNIEKSYKRYNPAKAMALETFIPGGGHFYLQNYNDALTSLFLKSVLIGSSIFFFQDGNYFAGVGTGLAGGVFYVGSVKSAGQNAHELNNLHSNAFASKYINALDEDKYEQLLPIFNFNINF